MATIRSDLEIRQTVTDALRGAPDLDAANVAVEVVDRTVYLRGTIPTTEQKQLAVELARGAPGVREVVDDLKVVGRG